LVPDDFGIEITRWQTLDGDEITGQTAVPYVFTGGDCLTGPSSLIAAVAAGTRSATAIDLFLSGDPLDPDDKTLWEQRLKNVKIYDPDEKIALPPGYDHAHYGHMPVEDRITHFGEVEDVFSAKGSLAEAFRCLRCYRLAMFAH
jgi:formate dehydrogenase beta subunit